MPDVEEAVRDVLPFDDTGAYKRQDVYSVECDIRCAIKGFNSAESAKG